MIYATMISANTISAEQRATTPLLPLPTLPTWRDTDRESTYADGSARSIQGRDLHWVVRTRICMGGGMRTMRLHLHRGKEGLKMMV